MIGYVFCGRSESPRERRFYFSLFRQEMLFMVHFSVGWCVQRTEEVAAINVIIRARKLRGLRPDGTSPLWGAACQIITLECYAPGRRYFALGDRKFDKHPAGGRINRITLR